jgi:hypothetical protein
VKADLRNHFITAVCGFPRSGTSMMMQMLHAGGMPVFTDLEKAGNSYETEAVTGLPEEAGFLADCYGKAVKLLDPLRWRPPRGHPYRFIWMDRDFRQTARSQAKFLRLLAGLPSSPRDIKAIRRSLEKERPVTLSMLRDRTRNYARSDLLVVRFEDVLKDPLGQAVRVSEFLGGGLHVGAMAECVVSRDARCLRGLLEAERLRTGRRLVTP